MMLRRRYQYKDLNPDHQEIRIITVHPGAFSTGLSCSIATTTLSSPTPYEALSYTWGTQYSSSALSINGGEGELAITLNLETALRYLRQEKHERTLWVDAICINQSKKATEEKNSQVKNMRHIYEKATRVVAWLGHESEDSGLVVDLVGDLKSHDFSQEAVTNSLKDSRDFAKWRALFNLCNREYWNRIWIVQEIVCSGAAILKFGNCEIDCEDLGWIGRRAIYSMSALVPEMVDAGFPSLARVSARRSLQILVQKNKRPSLLDLLHMTRRYNCTEPRDRIYGVLDMSQDYQSDITVIKYELPTAKVFLDAIVQVITTSQKLNIICEHEVTPTPLGPAPWPPSNLDLPSWVPDWTVKPGISYLRDRLGNYCAVGALKALPIFSPDNRIMTVEGLHLGHIEVLGETYFSTERPAPVFAMMKRVIEKWVLLALNGNSPISCSQMIPTWEDERTNAFWRTLIGNTIQDGRKIDQELYRKMFDVARGQQPCPADFPALLNEKPEDTVQRYIAPIVNEWSDLIFNRRFFTSGHALMGLCPPTAQVGDVIAILAGCDHPVILHEGETTTFLGEAYVHGFMDGEVIEVMQAGKLQLQKFSLH